jgi:hypothetical protein
MLSAVMLSVIMLNVVASFQRLKKFLISVSAHVSSFFIPATPKPLPDISFGEIKLNASFRYAAPFFFSNRNATA